MAWYKSENVKKYDDYSGQVIDGSNIMSDESYTYANIPNKGIYDTESIIRLPISSTGSGSDLSITEVYTHNGCISASSGFTIYGDGLGGTSTTLPSSYVLIIAVHNDTTEEVSLTLNTSDSVTETNVVLLGSAHYGKSWGFVYKVNFDKSGKTFSFNMTGCGVTAMCSIQVLGIDVSTLVSSQDGTSPIVNDSIDMTNAVSSGDYMITFGSVADTLSTKCIMPYINYSKPATVYTRYVADTYYNEDTFRPWIEVTRANLDNTEINVIAEIQASSNSYDMFVGGFIIIR